MMFADDYKMSVACAFFFNSLLFISSVCSYLLQFPSKGAKNSFAKADWMCKQKNVYIWLHSSSIISLNLSCAFY